MSDGIRYMRFHTIDLLKLFIWGKEVFIADSTATHVKSVNRKLVNEAVLVEEFTVGETLPENVYRKIDAFIF